MRSKIQLRWLAVALVVVSLGGVAYVRFSKTKFLEFKKAHETTATVKEKEHVILDDKNQPSASSMKGDSEQATVSDQWRVYYQIDSFSYLPEDQLHRVTRAEEERLVSFGPRFTSNSKEWFDKVELGDRLELTYRVRENGEIEIISVVNPKYPSLH